MLSIDLEILYFFNVTLSAVWLDSVMGFLTNVRAWFPVYIFGALFLIAKYKWRGVRMVIGCALLITCADLLCNRVIKEIVARPRPCLLINDPSGLYSWIRTPDGVRQGYGFPSAHAVNNFAGFVFFLLLFPKSRKTLWFLIPIIIPGITRLYLGLHYPSDVIGGMMIGALLGWIFAMLYKFIEKKFFVRSNKL